MSKRLKAGRVDEMANGRLSYDYEDEEMDILILRVEDEFFAVVDECTHEELPLSKGLVHDCELECPYHHARFDLRTGEALSLPAVVPLRTFPVTVEDGDIYIDV